MTDWKLKCLMCCEFESSDLATVQEHAIKKHGVTHDELRGQTQSWNEQRSDLIYILPDGRGWLGAKKIT